MTRYQWTGLATFIWTLVLAGPVQAAKTYGSVMTGYYGGLGFLGTVGIRDFLQDSTLRAEFGIGYSFVDAGEPMAARRVFINNATNGTPQESGSVWSFNLDVAYPLKLRKGPKELLVFGGIRHARFKGHFDYVGGNEEFDVTSNPWGLGAGVKALFPLNKSVQVVVSGGLDFFFRAAISGHDTTYSPDNNNINPKENYTYSDATDAVNVPRFRPSIMIGLQF